MEENRSPQAITNFNIEIGSHPNLIAREQPPQNAQNNQTANPVNGTNCLQQTFFTWVYKLLSKSQTEDITVESTATLPTHLRAQYEFTKYIQNREEWRRKGLLSMLGSIFGRQIAFLIFLCLIVEVFYLSYPILIYFNIEYLQNHKQDLSYGITLFIITMFSSFMYNYTYTNLKFRVKCLGVNISTHLNLIIFQKSLHYSLVGDKQFKEADIRGLSEIDTENLMLISRLYYFVFGIVDFIVGFGLLYWFVGLAFLAGLVATVLISIITYFVTSYGIKVTEKAFQSRDQRLSTASQMLKIIRFIKLNAMQKFFYKKIQIKRQEQLTNFKSKGIIQICLVFLYYLTAPLLLTATIVTYLIIHETIDPTKVYTTMMIAVIFQVTAQQLPKTTSELLSVLRSIERINQFLQAPEIDMRNYKHSPISQGKQFAIIINNGDFFIREDEININALIQRIQQQNNDNPQINPKQNKVDQQIQNYCQVRLKINNDLQNNIAGISSRRQLYKNQQLYNGQIAILKGINLNIKKGKLYMIFGDIGSGKSMLLLSILNELNKKDHSQIEINGKIAYVSQKPWIFSGTVQNNICFTFEKDQKLLGDALKYSCLQDDVKQMPKGKQTQIGQNGINLSGGQKFRVDLARSLYSQSDIYLYDDVLSAVDIHVGTFILEQTIKGFLNGKTVLMATHAIKFAQKADYIILMNNGQIVACDQYQQIKSYPQFNEIQIKIMQRQKMSTVNNQEKVQSIISNIVQDKQEDKQVIVQQGVQSGENEHLIEELILPQDQQKDEVDIKIYKEYVRLNGGYICFLLIIVLCFLAYSTLQTTASIILANWSLNYQNDKTHLYIFIALAMTANIFIFIEAVVLLLSGVKQGRQVHNSIIKGLLYASLTNFFNRVPLGRIINRLGKDLKQLDQVIANTLSSTLIAFFRILSAIFICIYTSTPFALIPVAFVVVVFLKIRKFYLKCQTKIIRLQKITNSPLVISFTNGIIGATSIRSYKNSNNYLLNHINLVNNYKQVLFSHYAISCWFILVLVCLGYIINMFCIGYSMFSSTSNPAYMGLLLTYILNLNDQLFQFVLDQAEFQAKLVSLERLYNFMTLAPEKGYTQYCAKWNQLEQFSPNFINKGQIQFKQASVRYRTDLPKVLKNVSFKIKAGESVGIVGRTGSGKTTILNTLIRITELSQGQILIDNKKINDIQLKSLRKQITVIDQQPVIINSTFKQNLDVFNQYSDQQLIKIMQQCNIMDIVQKRGGLYGLISNDSLSAGQKQLICICRALLKNTRIVLIDEATANIDVKNDQIIQKVLASKFIGKTLLTIAHRLSTISNSDKIMVMQGGRVLQFGTPHELYQQGGVYYKMMMKYRNSGGIDQFQ